MEYFILNDVKSSDFGIYIINNNNDFTQDYMPPKKTTVENISGYDGNRYITQNYSPKTISLDLYIEDVSNSSLNRISKWLGQKGQSTLTLSYESFKVYTVTMENQSTVIKYLNGGKMNVEFIAYYPLAESKFSTLDIINNSLIYDDNYYYDSGLVYDSSILVYEFNNVTLTTNMNIYNGSNVNGAKPNIIIDGIADNITITKYKDIARTVIEDYITYGNFNGVLEINSLLRNCFLNNNVANATMSGRYFTLDSEVYNLADGKIVSNSTNTIVLESKSQKNDNYYNGNYVSIGVGINKQWYLITDYISLSNTIVLSESISEDLTGQQYDIYNLIDGVNYFTIEGTNMNINTIKFDFKFLYV